MIRKVVTGLNIEQRKRVTIGVELAARPQLLLFLDEPTSSLDSDTAWSICTLLRKLADNGQAILCTIHQPSGQLFQMFDRLLFLANGKSVYFGDIGPDSKVLINYFEKRGARRCATEENPAEWLLDVTGGVASSQNTTDWPEQWQMSEERQEVRSHLAQLKKALSELPEATQAKPAFQQYATSFITQLYVVTQRTIRHDWRTPSYLYSKLFLIMGMVGTSFYYRCYKG